MARRLLTPLSPRRSTSTSSPVRPAATFPPAAHCPLGSALDGVYPALLDPVLLPKEAARVSRPERPRGDAGHAFLAKPPAHAGLEPASSPGKGAEPRALAPAGPGHAALARTPAKSLAAQRASPEPPAAEPPREKTHSKPFSVQELELRTLGKTALTAATFIDAIIVRQIAHDKGPREGGSLANDSPRHGKTPGARLVAQTLPTSAFYLPPPRPAPRSPHWFWPLVFHVLVVVVSVDCTR